ncbi:MAG: Calcium-dependent protein kinase 14 [Marteilia pararefringens]
MDKIQSRRKASRANRAKGKGGKGGTSQIYNTFGPEEVQVRKEIFQVMKHDSSKDSISASDIKASYGDIGIMISDAAVQKMMEGHEEITFPTFLTLLTANQVSSPLPNIISAFSNFDMSGEGKLDVADLHDIICSPDYEDPLGEEVFEAIMNEVQNDGDMINYEALASILKIGTAAGIEDDDGKSK